MYLEPLVSASVEDVPRSTYPIFGGGKPGYTQRVRMHIRRIMHAGLQDGSPFLYASPTGDLAHGVSETRQTATAGTRGLTNNRLPPRTASGGISSTGGGSVSMFALPPCSPGVRAYIFGQFEQSEVEEGDRGETARGSGVVSGDGLGRRSWASDVAES